MCVIVPNSSTSVKRLQRYGDLAVVRIAAVRHLGFFKFNFLTVWAVVRRILHHDTKFRKNQSNRRGDIAIFVIFQDGGRCHLGFSKIRHCNDWSAATDQCESACQISSKSVERSQRYGDLSVFFKMAAVRHLEFFGRLLGPRTMTTWWSVSLCQIWLKSMQ